LLREGVLGNTRRRPKNRESGETESYWNQSLAPGVRGHEGGGEGKKRKAGLLPVESEALEKR